MVGAWLCSKGRPKTIVMEHPDHEFTGALNEYAKERAIKSRQKYLTMYDDDFRSGAGRVDDGITMVEPYMPEEERAMGP